MSWTLTTSQAAISAAGSYANTTIVASGATLAKWSDYAEGRICAKTRYDWVTNYASVGTNYKGILGNVAANMIAKMIINYNMDGYTSRAEAQTMLNVLYDDIADYLRDLKDKAVQDVMV